ncbi:MAG: DUF1801 domain-containing protein [Bacteroidia bacterium]|nr:DUF1801 domain-containing protein [Bacteroidia bacterium]
MQNVSFGNLDEFLKFLPEDELKITSVLRKTIFDCVPEMIEKLSYNVPFYKRYKNICFIWPASVLWGAKKSYQGVRFGFTNGNLLSDNAGFLHRGDRKQVFRRDFKSVKEIDVALLKSFIFEAAIIDEQLGKKK